MQVWEAGKRKGVGKRYLKQRLTGLQFCEFTPEVLLSRLILNESNSVTRCGAQYSTDAAFGVYYRQCCVA
jgi:hypothetical protein